MASFARCHSTEHVESANSLAELRISDPAKRVQLGRRTTLQSLCGAATTLVTLNELARHSATSASTSSTCPRRAHLRPQQPQRASRRRVHLRRADPHGRPGWSLTQLRGRILEAVASDLPQASCGSDDRVDYFSSEQFISTCSCTEFAVLSFVPNCAKTTHFRSKRRIGY